jgi:hypothetical protein
MTNRKAMGRNVKKKGYLDKVLTLVSCTNYCVRFYFPLIVGTSYFLVTKIVFFFCLLKVNKNWYNNIEK